MIPKSGGDYAYIGVAFGPLPAFLYLWVALLILVPTGNAITALTFAQYLLQPFWSTCDAPIEAVRLLAAVITCKWRGCRGWGVLEKPVFSALKTSVLTCVFSRPSDRHQLLQRQVGDARHRHIHGDEDPGAAGDCGGRRFVFVQRQHGEFREPVLGIAHGTRLHCAGLLQRSVLVLGLELFELCHRGAAGSVQVSCFLRQVFSDPAFIENVQHIMSYTETCRVPFASACRSSPSSM